VVGADVEGVRNCEYGGNIRHRAGSPERAEIFVRFVGWQTSGSFEAEVLHAITELAGDQSRRLWARTRLTWKSAALLEMKVSLGRREGA
jgi:hypothetical protein